VSFDEVGLPVGTLWSIETITPSTGWAVDNATSGATVAQRWANGSYNYTVSADILNYTPDQPNGTFTVAGASVLVPIHFLPARSIRFVQRGLPLLQPWTVSVEGNGTWVNQTWAGPIIALWVPPGPYAFTVGAKGYNAAPASGSSNGSGPAQYSVNFVVAVPAPGYLTGEINVGSAAFYLNGYRYYIQVGGGYFFTLRPGTYSIIVTAEGYISYYNSTFISSGNTTYLDIPLVGVPAPLPAVAASPGIDSTGWVIIGGLVVLCFILGGAAVLLRRRPDRRPTSSIWVPPIEPADLLPPKDPPQPPT
jgi:hypothetical protein